MELVTLQPRRAYVNELAEYLDTAIRRQQISQMEASLRAGLSRSTVSAIIASGRATYASLLKIADALDIPKDVLLEKGGFSFDGAADSDDSLTPDERSLLLELRALPDESRRLVRELVSTAYRRTLQRKSALEEAN